MTPEAMAAYTDQVSVGPALLAFFGGFIFSRKNRSNKAFPSLLAKAAAASAVPQALVMIYGAFNPAVLTKVPGLRIAIAFGGLCLLWIALKAFTTDPED
jgi:hypothetical protein